MRVHSHSTLSPDGLASQTKKRLDLASRPALLALLLSSLLFGLLSSASSGAATQEDASASSNAQDAARDAIAGNQQKICDRLLSIAEKNPRLELFPATHERTNTRFVQGYYRVFENRETRTGREIKIGFAVLPARGENPAPDPVFILHGGPGAPATALFRRNLRSWMRERRDIVLIDQRGTGSSNPLHVKQLGSDDDIQSYFESMFRPDVYQAALPALQQIAELTQYTTHNAIDDFDEIREALGYEKINLRGGSYGTRSALVYLRRHPERIRCASLQAIQPISYRNPLPHARSAQVVLDQIFEECRSTAANRAAFPDIETKFQETLARLAKEAVEVTVSHPKTREDVTVTLDRSSFAESVRVLLYTVQTNRELPRLLMKAHAGDYREIAETGLTHFRSVRSALAFGTLMCVVNTEDISRIDADEIEEACRGTFLGEVRIRNQMAVGAIWPRGKTPEGFDEPVSVDVPVLLFSGTHDPSTSSLWGAEAAGHLPNSLHVVVPGAHGVFGQPVVRLDRAFLEAGSVKGLDLSEIEKMKLPPLVLPEN